MVNRALSEVIDETLAAAAQTSRDEDEKSSRQRRSDHAAQKAPHEQQSVRRLFAIEPTLSTCGHPLLFASDQFRGMDIGVCVSARYGNTPPRAVLGDLSRSLSLWTEKIAIPQELGNPRMVATFKDENELRVLIADPTTEHLVIHKIDANFVVDSATKLDTHYPTAIAVWNSPSLGQYHLAAANSPGPSSNLGAAL